MVLVKPSRVLFSKQEVEGFHPYLHEAPTELRNYMTVLETIGVKQTLGGQHIQIVLEALHNKYRECTARPKCQRVCEESFAQTANSASTYYTPVVTWTFNCHLFTYQMSEMC